MATRCRDKIQPLPTGWAEQTGGINYLVTAHAKGGQNRINQPRCHLKNGSRFVNTGIYRSVQLCHILTMTEIMHIFNRQALRQHRDRAATAGLDQHDFLFRESAERLTDRLADISRLFPLALDLGCHGGDIARNLQGRGGIETLIQSDLSRQMLNLATGVDTPIPSLGVLSDEEFLPFRDQSFDLIISNLNLHWVNDLPGALMQIRRALKPDGLFLAVMFGTETLYELRHSLSEAEVAIEGGLSPRVSPFADLKTLGGLLQRAGFNLPVADTENIEVSYPNALKLMADLRGMGESNAVADKRRHFTRRDTLMKACSIYQEQFIDQNERVPATFEMITLTAWAPAPTQPKPLKPGTAKTSLADFLDT